MVVECAVSPPYVKHPNNYSRMCGKRKRDCNSNGKVYTMVVLVRGRKQGQYLLAVAAR